jgi:carboxyl-terminal processing protease
MNNRGFKNIFIAGALATGISILSSCKKNVADQPATNPAPTTNNGPSAEYKMKDSVLQLTRDIYLWYQQIPSTFDPQTYATPVEAMTAIRAYSIEPGIATAVDRWSFAIKKTEWDNSSTGHVAQVDAANTDLGMNQV